MNDEIREAFSDLYREMMFIAHRQDIRSLSIKASSDRRTKAFHTSQRYNYFSGCLDLIRLGIQESGYSDNSRYNLLIILRFLEEVGDSELSGKLQGIIDALDDPSPPADVEPALATFSFCGQSYSIDHWYEHLVKACKILRETPGVRFDRALGFTGPKGRDFFSRDPGDLLKAELIPGTDIYVEINLGKDAIIQLAGEVSEYFKVEPPQILNYHPKPDENVR